MIVIKKDYQVFYPKLDIRACLSIDKLYGDVTAPLKSYMTLDTQVLLLSLSLRRYHLNDDELYGLIDSVEDLYQLILEIYQESGLINLDNQKDTLQSEYGSNNDIPSGNVTFESHMMDLLEQCMSIGMREEDFYNSTLSQVTRYVEAYNKQQENKLQELAYFDYQLANLIGVSVARLINKSAKYPDFHKVYPFISTNEKEVDPAWEMERQRMKLIEWAEQMNQKMTKKESC